MHPVIARRVPGLQRLPAQRGGHSERGSDPINTATGNFHESFADLSIPGRGPGLALSHAYNSLQALEDAATAGPPRPLPLGYGWTHSYAMSLAEDPLSKVVTVRQESGAVVRFYPAGAGYEAPPRTVATLERESVAGPFVLTRGDGTKLRFSPDGKLSSITDRNGYATTLSYRPDGTLEKGSDSVQPTPRTLTFSWAGPRITSVTDISGRVVRFEYNDGAGNLTDYFDADNGHWTFTYDAHRLATMRRPRHDGTAKVTANEYLADTGKVWRQTDELQRQTTIEYRDRLHQGHRPQGQRHRGRLRRPGAEVPQRAASLAPRGPRRGRSTPTTTRSGSPRSPTPTARRAPPPTTPGATADGHRPPAAHHRRHLQRLRPATDGHRRKCDHYLRVRRQAQPEEGFHPAQQQAGSPVATRTTAYDYDPARPGDLIKVTDPMGKAWEYGYDSLGNRSWSKDPLGNMTKYGYHGGTGEVVSVTSPAVWPPAWGHCACRRPSAAPAWATTSGAISPPSPTVRTAPRPASTTPTATWRGSSDANQHTTTYVYDDADQLTKVQRAGGQPAGHRLLARRQRQSHHVDGANQATTFTYDAQGRLKTMTDPLERTTTYGYDPAGHAVTKAEPNRTCPPWQSGWPVPAGGHPGCTVYGPRRRRPAHLHRLRRSRHPRRHLHHLRPRWAGGTDDRRRHRDQPTGTGTASDG